MAGVSVDEEDVELPPEDVPPLDVAPEEPAVPLDPVEAPEVPEDPDDPGDPDDPVEPVEPAEPVELVEPVDPVEPVEPVDVELAAEESVDPPSSTGYDNSPLRKGPGLLTGMEPTISLAMRSINARARVDWAMESRLLWVVKT